MDNKSLLDKILNHAYETVPYYGKLFDENNIKMEQNYDFKAIPLLTKDTVLRNEDLFISNKYKTKFYSGELSLKKTSGSTGKCMNIYWLPNDYYISNIEAWKYRNAWYNISIKDKYISFHSTLYINNNLVYNPQMVIKQNTHISLSKTSLNKENIHLYLQEIEEFKPIWMFLQPSILYTILYNANSNELHILNSLKYIDLMSEYLHKSTRKYFEERLPNVKFGNMYGTTETGSISLECPYGNQHILNNSIIEIFDDNFKNVISNSTEGNIVLTSLRNTAMPFIRYCIGDRGSVIESQCKCGYQGQDTNITLGRENDIIELQNGNKKHSSILINIIEEINDEYDNAIIQFYFIQDKIDSFKIYLSIKEKYKYWLKSIETTFKKSINKHISDNINCVFKYDFEGSLNDKNKLKVFIKNF